MKLPPAVIVTKGVCYVLIGSLTPLAAALAQWANSGEWPPDVVWIVILSGCVVGGATQLLSFLSSSYSTYVQTRTILGAAPPPTSAKPGP